MEEIEIKKINKDKLEFVLVSHKLWLITSGEDGEQANLSKVNLSRMDLMGADLRKADLSEADLSYVDLSYANLWKADLCCADLSYADLNEANLSEADLSGADLSGADLSEAELTQTILYNTKMKKGAIETIALSLNNYQKQANSFRLENASSLEYAILGVNGEAGELAEKMKKIIRDGKDIDKKEFMKETGDVLWYVAALCQSLGCTLEDVARLNINKLSDRKLRGKISGNGDNR